MDRSGFEARVRALWPGMVRLARCVVSDQADAEDAAAQAVVDRYLDDLACGVANIVNIFFPEVIALSGGVANQGDALLVPLRERVRALSYGSRYAVRHTRIELCTLGYRAGVIGAALLAKQS